MDQTSVITAAPWYRSLESTQWRALVAANLGWLFDGYENYALILTAGLALHQLLDVSQASLIPAYVGGLIAINVFGWGLGGMLGGVLADYIGRRRTMMLAILGYSLLTALSAFAWNWQSLAVMRFFVGLAIGSEWVTGASMVAELWPPHARGKGGGIMHCGIGIGSFLAALVWLGVGTLGPDAWRYLYLTGVLPALLTLWIRRGVPESPLWERAREQRRAARQQRRSGVALAKEETALTRFTVVDLFAEPGVRRRLIVSLLMVLSTVVAWWGVSSWIPPYVGSVAGKAGLIATQWIALAGMTYNAVGVVGYVSIGFLTDRFGRKPVTMTFFLMSLVMNLVLFLGAWSPQALLIVVGVHGFFTLGLWAWATIWLPELFPTRMRATAMAFVFNAPRLVAAMGPLVAGALIVMLGGMGVAAAIVGSFYALGLVMTPFLPETRGMTLPDRV
jgi:MFS family permease